VSDQDSEAASGEAIRELNDLCSSLGTLTVATEKANSLLVGFGWWVRVIRTAEGIRILHEASLSHEASPLLRTVLHHTVALEWLRRYPEEVLEALADEHRRRRQSVGQKAKARDWDLTGIAWGPPPPGTKAPGLQYLRNFEELCDHVQAPNAYVAYMAESTYAHASGLSAGRYFERDEEGRTWLSDGATMPGIPLRATVMFAATATNILGTFIGDDRLIETAGGIGERLSVPVTLAPAAEEAL
jgi:hypothetical protein